MGTANHAMWSPALAGSQEPRLSAAPLGRLVRDGLRLAAPVAATALAVAALAAPTTAGLDDLSTWVPNAAAAAPAGPGAATAGPAGDGKVTVRINRRSPRVADGPLALPASPVMAGKAAVSRTHPTRLVPVPRAARPAPQRQPVAPEPAPAASAPAPAASPATATATAPAPASSPAPAPAPAPASGKRSGTTTKAKPKSATAGSQTTTSSETSFTAASSGTSAPADERKSDKARTKAEKADGSQPKHDR